MMHFYIQAKEISKDIGFERRKIDIEHIKNVRKLDDALIITMTHEELITPPLEKEMLEYVFKEIAETRKECWKRFSLWNNDTNQLKENNLHI